MRVKLCYIFLFYQLIFQAQSGLFVNGSDASLRVDSNSFLSVDGDFYNINCDPTSYVRFNGTLYLSGSLVNNDSLRFSATTGTGNSKKARIIFRSTLFTPTNSIGAIIGGSIAPVFWEVEFDKNLGNQLTLINDVRCMDTLTFKSGFLYLNGYKWKMIDPSGTPIVINHPYLKNEKNTSQFVSSWLSDTGLVIYKTIYTNSTNINPANLGIEISGPLNIGSPLQIYRGVKQQVNAAKSSILRYYDIYSPGHSLVNNLLKIKYTFHDVYFNSVGYLNTNDLTVYASPNTDMNWSQLPSASLNTMIAVSPPTLNGEMSVNLSDLSLPNTSIAGEAFRITIADPNCPTPPISALLLDTVHICTGNTLVLDAGNNTSVSNSSLKWEWNTTPANYAKTLTVSPTNTYQKYNVKLIDVRGCVTKDSVIIAPQAPYPQITYLNHLNACSGDSIIIKDTVKISSGTYTNFWQFSDATTGTTVQQTFKKLFQSTGTHAFQLTSTSNFGCTVTASSTNVIIYPLPSVSFTNSFNCNTGSMNFTNTSVSNYSTLIISSSSWNFGQGATNSSTLFSPSMTYSSSGNYTVKLVSTSSFGCKDSVSSMITIYPLNQAQFTKNNSCFNDTVHFSNLSVCNTGSCTYEWSFGDQTQSNTSSPKKVYSGTGLYTAKLKVTNPFGCPDSISTSVFISPNPVAQIVSSSTIACLNEYLYFTNTSTVSSGSISNYFWNFNNSYTSTTTNAATNYSLAGIYSVSLTAQSDSGCTHVISLPISVHGQPLSQYNVNPACLGSPSQFVSTSTGSGLSYVWDFGNSVITNSLANSFQNYTYSAAGNYNTQLIVIDTWGCRDTSYVSSIVLPTPSVSLGGNISTCGTSYTLNAGNSGANYLWQPGNQTTQLITVNSSGNYNVVITNTNGCIGTESVQVTLNANVKPHLGNDTTVCGEFKLNAGYPGSIYSWNTGSANQTFLATSSGTYIVQVTDQNGCAGQDTIHLAILSPATIDLGNNLTVCKPKYGLLITPTTNATSFHWSNGDVTPTIRVLSNGTYWCETQLTNGCKKRDTISINFKTTPAIDLGANKTSCSTLLLDAQNLGCTYLWSTGSTEQIISVESSSNYFVTVSNTLSGCSQQDSINILIYPSVKVDLGNDTTVCNNINFNLTAKNPGSIYEWTNGASTENISITSSGVYGVTVTSINGCSTSDFIQINLIGAPLLDLGNSTQYLCGDSPINLQLSNSGIITWNSDAGLNVTSSTISVNKSGKYWATVYEYGCSAADTVFVISTTHTIQASFLASTIDTINKPVKFVNLSMPSPISQWWDFGDGTNSIEFSPLHTFVLPTNYSITLEVNNGFCKDRVTKELNALFKTSPNENESPSIGLQILAFLVYPNPSTNFLNIQFELNHKADVHIRILDVSGRIMIRDYSETKINYSPSINIQELNNGIYFLAIEAQSTLGNINKSVKFIKTN